MLIPVTTILITVFATIIYLFVTSIGIERDRRPSDREWGVLYFTNIIGGLIIGLVLSLLTVPAAMFIFGEWAWPVSHWPLWLQLGILIPLPLWAVSMLAMLFTETEISKSLAVFSFLALLLVTPTVGILGLLPILPTVPEVGLIIVYGGFLLLLFSGPILWPLSLIFGSDFESVSETLTLLSFLWLPVSGATLVVVLLVSVSLWFLFVIPVILFLLFVASIAGEGGGGGYNGAPGISWFISS